MENEKNSRNPSSFLEKKGGQIKSDRNDEYSAV